MERLANRLLESIPDPDAPSVAPATGGMHIVLFGEDDTEGDSSFEYEAIPYDPAATREDYIEHTVRFHLGDDWRDREREGLSVEEIVDPEGEWGLAVPVGGWILDDATARALSVVNSNLCPVGDSTYCMCNAALKKTAKGLAVKTVTF
jgi:hypothetical protein